MKRKRLELGLTPVTLRAHVVLLTERVDATLMQQLRLQPGKHWKGQQIILRSGSPLNLNDLAQVDFAHAAAIVMPAMDTVATSAMDADAQIVKTLMTLGDALDENPLEELSIVAELQEPRHTASALPFSEGNLYHRHCIAGFNCQTPKAHYR